MAASTLLDDVFDAAIAYWQANAVGTRAGLVTHLAQQIQVSSEKSASWVDAFTQAAYGMAFTDTDSYHVFKTWLQGAGFVRGLVGVNAIFGYIRSGALQLDARDQQVAKLDVRIAAADVKMITVSEARTAVASQPQSDARDETLAALDQYSTHLQVARDSLLVEKQRLALLG